MAGRPGTRHAVHLGIELAAGTALVTSPYAAASVPLNTAPPSAVSAAAREVIRGKTVSEIAAGVSASLTSVSANVGVLGGDSDVGRGHDADAAGPHRAEHPGHHRLGELHDPALQLDDPARAVLDPLPVVLGQVGARAEHLALGADDHDPHLAIGASRSRPSYSSVTSFRESALRLWGESKVSAAMPSAAA